jgi:hypothetical protein
VRDWRGLIALILAVGVSIALVAGVLTAELTPTQVTSEEIAFLSTLGGASVGAIAAYLGIRHPDQRSDMTTEDPDTTTEPTPTEPEPDENGGEEQTTPLIGDDEGEGEDVGPDTD